RACESAGELIVCRLVGNGGRAALDINQRIPSSKAWIMLRHQAHQWFEPRVQEKAVSSSDGSSGLDASASGAALNQQMRVIDPGKAMNLARAIEQAPDRVPVHRSDVQEDPIAGAAEEIGDAAPVRRPHSAAQKCCALAASIR